MQKMSTGSELCYGLFVSSTEENIAIRAAAAEAASKRTPEETAALAFLPAALLPFDPAAEIEKLCKRLQGIHSYCDPPKEEEPKEANFTEMFASLEKYCNPPSD